MYTVHIHMCVTHTHIYIYTCIYNYIHVCMYICIHTHTHTHKYIYLYIYIHTGVGDPANSRGRGSLRSFLRRRLWFLAAWRLCGRCVKRGFGSAVTSREITVDPLLWMMEAGFSNKSDCLQVLSHLFRFHVSGVQSANTNADRDKGNKENTVYRTWCLS